jgi:hypothetical protein
MENQAEKYLIEIDHKIFQNETTRKEFVKLIIKQSKLERELFNNIRQINSLKYKNS